MCGPLTVISPFSPMGISVWPFLTSTIRKSVHETGRPAECDFLKPIKGLLQVGAPSVMPYPSNAGMPVRFSHSVLTCSANGAPPLPENLTAEKSTVSKRG